MQKFKDSNGRDWCITVDVRAIARVRDLCQIDLAKLFDDNFSLMQALFEDPVKLSDVLWVLINTGDRLEFDTGFTGDTLEHAANAMIEAVIDFFPNPKRREALRETLRKSWEAVNLQTEQVLTEIHHITPTQLLSAMRSQESSESIPQA